ncbi:MAG: MFS transporter [Gammaproteobacteria bacterium]|nr:MFS transporter [Gammaproteobacteria bacterium]
MSVSPRSRFQRWRATTLAPFRYRIFAMLWWASLASSFGGLIQTVGASWQMALIAPAPDQVALVQAVGVLPFFLLSLIAGALADNYDRRLIMMLSQCLALFASLVLAALAFLGMITPTLLLWLTFFIGCGAAAFAPAWQASIAEQVPRETIPAAIMANAMGFNLARSIGPAIGGMIVAAAGAVAAFAINAVSYAGLIFVLKRWKLAKPERSLPPEPLVTAISAGVRYVRLSPNLTAIMIRAVLFTVPITAVPALMPVVARDLLGGGAPTFGVLLGGFGFGAMLGALSSAAFRARFSSDALLQGLCAVAMLAMLGISQSPWATTTFLAHVVAGLVWTLGLATFNIAVQLSSPRWVTGRTLAMYQTFAFAGMALGAWLWGLAASEVGLRLALAVAALSSILTFVVARWLPVLVAQSGSLDPHLAASLEPPRVTPHASAGPIVVTIEYLIPKPNAVEFVAVINELGRIRRRDGARRWSVCQDLDDPTRWIERFESPTWIDYLRRQTRPTLADQDIRRRLSELIDGERGKIRRYIERPTGSAPLGTDSSRIEPLDDTVSHS